MIDYLNFNGKPMDLQLLATWVNLTNEAQVVSLCDWLIKI